MRLKLFFRKSISGFRSIEELFEVVLRGFREYSFDIIEVPEKQVSLSNMYKNLVFAKKARGKINHITGDIHYVALATGRRTVLTIHDAYSVLRGNYLRRFFVKVLWFWLPAIIVKRITTISEKSKNELERIIPFAKRKISVIPNPYNPGLLQEERHYTEDVITNTSKPIVLHLGTKENKNLERTIMAMEGLPYKLYVIGKLSETQAGLLARYQIDFCSYFNLPYSEVATLYHQCGIVCFASLYEGFGMPILEGQLVGKPVLTSSVNPMPWVAGEGGAHFVDPYSIEDIRSGIVQLMEDTEYRKRIVTNGRENVKRFEPGKIARMYESVYEEIINK